MNDNTTQEAAKDKHRVTLNLSVAQARSLELLLRGIYTTGHAAFTLNKLKRKLREQIQACPTDYGVIPQGETRTTTTTV